MTAISHRSVRRGAGGFTLLEVVAAVFVFLVGVVGVLSLFAAASVFHKGAEDRTLASLAAERVLADIDYKLKEGVFRDGQGGLRSPVKGTAYGIEPFGYEVEFREQGWPGRSLIQARVRVTWQEKGKVRGEEFDHVFAPAWDVRAAVSSSSPGNQ